MFQSIQNWHSGGSVLSSVFSIFEKYEMSAFTGKKINAIAILENFLSSCDSTICKKMDFGASDLDFQVQKIKMPYHFF